MTGTVMRLMLGLLLLGGCSSSGTDQDTREQAQEVLLPGEDSLNQDQLQSLEDLGLPDLDSSASELGFDGQLVDLIEQDGHFGVRCNGHQELCERPYDQVSYPCTHNAMASEDWGFYPPNQLRGIETQLADGVRAFMLDTHELYGEALLCHGVCLAGSRPLAEGLGVFKVFLEANPGEVVTIIFESYISANMTAEAFADAGLVDLLHVQQPGEPWPTLGEMVESGRRMVVFTDSDPGDYPWHHPIWDFAWETHWAATTPEDLSCEKNRGSYDNSLFILNHFLTDTFADPSLAEQINFNPFFIDRALGCRDEKAQLPNFVTVDFYSIGDLLEVVEELNGF